MKRDGRWPGPFASAQRNGLTGPRLSRVANVDERWASQLSRSPPRQGTTLMNRIIWLVGAVVIVLFVLGYFGLR